MDERLQSLSPPVRNVHGVRPWPLNAPTTFMVVASSDFELSTYNLGTTSVRLIRAVNIIQIVFSNRTDAKVVYAELASKFMSDEKKFRSGR